MANNTLLASDNFASGSLAAGWSAWPALSVCQVTGSPKVTEANVLGTAAGQIWTGLTWPNDQICEITTATYTTDANANLIQMGVRIQGGAGAVNGYLATLANSTGVTTLQVLKSVAGTQTQIGSTVTGLTFAAGDVWALGAFGSCISVYQNGVRIFYIGDASVPTGGVPGYQQLRFTSNLAANQVGSFRGYSAVQQDGIWQKQGVIVPAIAAQLSGSPATGTGITGPEGVRYEGNAQVLSGTVYKGYFNTPQGVYYAESLDGIAWSFYSGNPVLSLYAAIDVFKLGSTYYLWSSLLTQLTTGPAYMLTSSNGINWSAGTLTNLQAGAGGAWDNPAAYFGLHIADNIAGTWYGLYSGTNGTGGKPSTGLATSPDGITWTKYAGNPVLVGAFCGTQILKIGSVYYAWMNANQPGQGQAVLPGFDPLETVRYQSTDLINWTNPTHSLHASGMWESLNSKQAGVFVTAPVQLGNRVALFYEGSPGDSTAPQVYQTGIALGPVNSTLAEIVAASEDGAVQVATDPFTSGAGDLSANWTVQTGYTKLKIVAGPFCQPSANNTVCSMVYTGASFSRQQYSEITLHTLASTVTNSYVMPCVLGATGAQTGYFAVITGPAGTIQNSATLNSWIIRKNAGVNTNLSAAVRFTPQIGDVFRFAVTLGDDGNNILSLYQNGFLIMQAEDYGTNLTTGSPGILQLGVVSQADSQISLWAGGNTNVIPTYPPISNAVGWSPVDCRNYGSFPNTGVVQSDGSVFYTGQTSSNSAIPPVDSRTAVPVDSRASKPVNSRVNPNP